jgi:hypothetical protein
MDWIDTTYEKAMKDYFICNLEKTKGLKLYGEYTSVRDAMIADNFFDEIKGQESDLSDHSARHIQDVFGRAYKVIGEDEFRSFSVYEIYCLALMILFHDVGNIYGRTDHDSHKKIAYVYNKYRNNPSSYRDERRTIIEGASAHTGTSKCGNKDTLKFVNEANIKGEKIDLKELAAILRFADELSEGKQRTCSFLVEEKLIKKASEIFHLYALITDITIDDKLERISIAYDIDIPLKFTLDEQKKIKELIAFTYKRAVKLDIERRYTKNYSRVIKKFKVVTIQYNFTKNEVPFDFELDKVVFEDQYPIPGNEDKKIKNFEHNLFVERDKSYDLKELMKSLKNKVK